MRVLHNAALLGTVQAMAYGAIASPPCRTNQRMFMHARVDKTWLKTYRDYNETEEHTSPTTSQLSIFSSLSLLQWAMNDGFELNLNCSATIDDAVRAGNISVLQHLQQHGAVFDNMMYCISAAELGYVHVLQWLREHDCPWNCFILCRTAATKGHLHIIQWVRDQDSPLSCMFESCNSAAKHGHIHILKWAHELHLPGPRPWWDAGICYSAAAGGHLNILQWAREQNPPCHWDSDTCCSAAKGGHLNILQWAREQDPPCPWDADTYYSAAGGGHLHILQWARDQEAKPGIPARFCRR
jgi:hypothetical protein